MNKRANISTFVFVMMVLVVCMFALWSFSKNNSQASSEFEDLSVNLERTQIQEQGNIYLQIISDKSLIYAYNESLNKFSKKVKLSEDINNEEFNVVAFSEFEKKEYFDFFKIKFKEDFFSNLDKYPENTLDKNLKEAFKTGEVEFDGDNFHIFIRDYSHNSNYNGINASYRMNWDYQISLSRLGLPELNKLAHSAVSCPDNSNSCIAEIFPELVFVTSYGDLELVTYKTKKSYYEEDSGLFTFEFNLLRKPIVL